jgi:hypothetical protein
MDGLLSKLEAYNENRNHPVLNKAIGAMRSPVSWDGSVVTAQDGYDQALYLIRMDSDKFEQDEKAWLRENGLLPHLPGGSHV